MADALDPDAVRWGLDRATRAAMLVQAARAALHRGDPVTAVVLAEEALDDVPDEADALLIVADAAPRYGHGEVGVLAARQAARLGHDARVLEAAAHLSACDVAAAQGLAEAVLVDPATRPTERARAHAVRAQCLDLLGQDSSADYAAAHAMRPEAYPRPLAVPETAWDGIVQAALSQLDAEARDVLRGAPLDVVDAPSLPVLRDLVPPPSPTSDVLARADGPLAIEVYRRNVVRGSRSLDDVVARVAAGLADVARTELETGGDA